MGREMPQEMREIATRVPSFFGTVNGNKSIFVSTQGHGYNFNHFRSGVIIKSVTFYAFNCQNHVDQISWATSLEGIGFKVPLESPQHRDSMLDY